MIKLIAFDWNGTLLSDAALTVKAENKALTAVGVKPITLTEFREAFDIPITKYWKNIGFSDKFAKANLRTLEDVFHLNYKKMTAKAETRSGVREILKWLKKIRIKTVIYSNHDIPDIKRHLSRLKLSGLLDEVLANKADERLQVFIRHKGEKLHRYCLKNKIKPHEIISVGDMEEEIDIAKKYGYHSVALTGGFNSTVQLKSKHPDFLINNMRELIGIIKKLNS